MNRNIRQEYANREMFQVRRDISKLDLENTPPSSNEKTPELLDTDDGNSNSSSERSAREPKPVWLAEEERRPKTRLSFKPFLVGTWSADHPQTTEFSPSLSFGIGYHFDPTGSHSSLFLFSAKLSTENSFIVKAFENPTNFMRGYFVHFTTKISKSFVLIW